MKPLYILRWRSFSRAFEFKNGEEPRDPPATITMTLDGQPWVFAREGDPHLDVYSYRATTPPPPEAPRFYGIAVRVDPSVPPGEIRIEATP